MCFPALDILGYTKNSDSFTEYLNFSGLVKFEIVLKGAAGLAYNIVWVLNFVLRGLNICGKFHHQVNEARLN